MRSRTTDRFRKLLERLPEEIRQQAGEAYKLFRQDPYHPRLHFKQIHQKQPTYSVRVTYRYRVVGRLVPQGSQEGDVMVWFWIGSHEDYNKLLRQL